MKTPIIVEVQLVKNPFKTYLYQPLLNQRLFWEIGKYTPDFQPIVQAEDGAEHAVGRYDIESLDEKKVYDLEWELYEKKQLIRSYRWIIGFLFAIVFAILFH